MIEYEKRFFLPTLFDVEAMLPLEWNRESRVVDIVFGLSGPTSIDTHGWVVRVRNDGGEVSLQYKAPLDDQRNSWEEISVKVGDFGSMCQLLSKTGLTSGMILDRTRKVATVEDCTISVDDVMFLGKFIEVEVEAESLDSAHSKIQAFMDRYDLQNLREAKPYGGIMLDVLKASPEVARQVEQALSRYCIQ